MNKKGLAPPIGRQRLADGAALKLQRHAESPGCQRREEQQEGVSNTKDSAVRGESPPYVPTDRRSQVSG